jgi:hypothetical protein
LRDLDEREACAGRPGRDRSCLNKIADLGIRFLPKDHKRVCSRLKRLAAKYGEFSWVLYGQDAAVLVVGVSVDDACAEPE